MRGDEHGHAPGYEGRHRPVSARGADSCNGATGGATGGASDGAGSRRTTSGPEAPRRPQRREEPAFADGQLATLAAEPAIDEAQGYLFSVPIPARQIRELLASSRPGWAAIQPPVARTG